MNFSTLLEDHSTVCSPYNERISNCIESYCYKSARHRHDSNVLYDICEYMTPKIRNLKARRIYFVDSFKCKTGHFNSENVLQSRTLEGFKIIDHFLSPAC